MIKLLNKIFSPATFTAIIKICNTAKQIFSFLSRKQEIKLIQNRQDAEDKAKKNISDTCDNGTLTDLINAAQNLGNERKKTASLLTIICCLLLFSGCTSISVTAAKSWEGHYSSIEDVSKALENVELSPNESIWVLSNSTLKSILTLSKGQ